MCVPSFHNESLIEDLVHEFGKTVSEDTLVETGILSCQEGIPELADAGTAYFSPSDQLCIFPSEQCYPKSLHCIEYVLVEKHEIQPKAAYCPFNTFQKWCAADEFMNEGVCTLTDELHSPYLTQLIETMHFRTPLNDPSDCVQLLLDNEVRW